MGVFVVVVCCKLNENLLCIPVVEQVRAVNEAVETEKCELVEFVVAIYDVELSELDI